MASIAPFDIDSPYFEGAVQVYAQTWSYPWGTAHSYFMRYAGTFPDFRGYVAMTDDRIVGMGFGTRSLPGQWWHDRVATQVGITHASLQDAWVLTELAVLAPYQGVHIGAALHDALLAAQPCPRALLSTDVSNLRARAFYERRGWRYLHPGFTFSAGNPPFLVMHKELRQQG